MTSPTIKAFHRMPALLFVIGTSLFVFTSAPSGRPCAHGRIRLRSAQGVCHRRAAVLGEDSGIRGTGCAPPHGLTGDCAGVTFSKNRSGLRHNGAPNDRVVSNRPM